MLIVLFGTMAEMGYNSRRFFDAQGFERVTKLSYVPEDCVITTYYEERIYATKEEVRKCDFVYENGGMLLGFNQDQIIDAVHGRKDCLLPLSSYSIDFIEKLKVAYGGYVTVIFVYTDDVTLRKSAQSLNGITDAEIDQRIATGTRLKELFLAKRKYFDEIVIWGGDDSTFNTDALYEQYLNIIQKARKTEHTLNNRAFVDLPYSGPDPYVFVSYSHDDKDKVYPLLSMLQRNGYRVWYDEGIKPGDNWRNLIVDKIEKCACVLLFSTAFSAKSDEVEYELDVAKDCKKELITIRMDSAVFPRAYEVMLKKKHMIFYPSDDNYAEKLMESLGEAKAT